MLVSVFLLAKLESQDYGMHVFNTQSRFADITVICTVYIQMSSEKKASSKFTHSSCEQIRTLIFFYRLKSDYSLRFSQLQNIRLEHL